MILEIEGRRIKQTENLAAPTFTALKIVFSTIWMVCN